MKKLVQIVSLSVALCLCCCFSTFGSVKASAVDYYDNAVFPDLIGVRMVAGSYSSTVNLPVEEFKWYEFDNYEISNINNLVFRFQNNTWDIVYNNDSYDYYVYAFVLGDGENLTFRPRSYFSINDAENTLHYMEYSYIDYYKYDSSSKLYGFSALAKIPDGWQNSIRGFSFGGSGAITANARFLVSVIQAPKDDDMFVQGVISAINNQTSALQGSIGQAADDIQQSIEDQYQIEEEEDFGFSDIQEQYEEKMGVLTFGTETTLQMLDLFSPSNAGEAYIRVPGWSMDIQGETYNVWNEYIFYFSWIEEWIPLLVRLMRTFTVTMFYIAILSYINKVYERNFLAK